MGPLPMKSRQKRRMMKIEPRNCNGPQTENIEFELLPKFWPDQLNLKFSKSGEVGFFSRSEIEEKEHHVIVAMDGFLSFKGEEIQ